MNISEKTISESFDSRSSWLKSTRISLKVGSILLLLCASFTNFSANDAQFDELLSDIKQYSQKTHAPVASASSSDVKSTQQASQSRSYFSTQRISEANELQTSLLDFLAQSKKVHDSSRITVSDYHQLVLLYENIKANDLLLNHYLASETQRLQKGAVTGSVILEHLEFIEKYNVVIQEIGSRLDAKFSKAKAKQTFLGYYDEDHINGIWNKFRLRWSLRAVTKELDKLVVKNKLPILGAASAYGRVVINPSTSLNTNSITPVYRTQDTALITPDELDYQGLNETELSSEVLKQARLLEYDYVRIFEYVKNNIQLEWYSGSFKGAEETLLSGSGNEVDQASLLIALYRASGLPARYVHGIVEQSIEELTSLTGITEPAQILRFLKESGISYEPVVRGGRIIAVQREYTWTAVYVPYSNYRGTHVDASGSTWIPLMPAVKNLTVSDSEVDSTSFNTALIEQIRQDYLSSEKDSTPLSQLIRKVEESLSTQGITESYQEYVKADSIEADVLELLPNSELLNVIRVILEESQLSEAYIPTVQIRSYQLGQSTSSLIFDVELPFNQVINKRTTWSYIPAEKEHHELANLYGGIYRTPAYLMRLRSQLKINGKTVAVGKDSVQMGVPHLIEITYKGEFGSIVKNKVVLSGGYHGISIAYDDLLGLPSEELVGDTESAAGKILGELAQTYTHIVNKSERETSSIFGVKLARAVPSLVFVSNANEVDNLLDQPQALVWNGVEMDALMLAASPIALQSSNLSIENAWIDLLALNSSAEEHQIFQQVLLVDSISADKGLQIANQTGIAILNITAANSASIETLPFVQEVKDDLNYWVQQGYIIEIPESAVQRNAWQGATWVVTNKTTGQVGYYIAGRLAGGATTEFPENWTAEWLRDLLSSPYDPLPNTDPNSAVSMVKVPASDFQFGVAGSNLNQNLAVLVRDVFGRPVHGARVIFQLSQGGGTFDGTVLKEVVTDFTGIAEAAYTLGESTELNRRYFRLNNGDEYPTQVGLNVVEAYSLDGVGLVLEQPFSAYTKPDAATEVLVIRGLSAVNESPASQSSERAVLKTVDQFNNPVANIPVSANVLEPTYGQCILPPQNPINGEILNDCTNAFPRLGECGVASKQNKTASNGITSYQFITGNTLLTDYLYQVSALGQTNILTRRTIGFKESNECDDNTNNPVFRLRYTRPAVDVKTDLDSYSAKITNSAPEPVEAKVEYLRYNYEIAGVYPDLFLRYYPDVNWVTTTGNLNFSVNNGALTSGAIPNGEGGYFANFSASTSANSHLIQVAASNVQGVHPVIEPYSTEVTLRDYYGSMPIRDVSDFYSLDPKVTSVTSVGVPANKDPNFIYVNEGNFSVFETEIEYTVLPNEFPATEVGLILYKDGVNQGYYPAPENLTNGTINIARGNRFDLESNYTFVLVVNVGSIYEVRSEAYNVAIRSNLLRSYTRSVSIYDEVDVNNDYASSIGASFHFETSADAYISLIFSERGTDPLQEPFAIKVIEDILYPAGENRISIDKSDLPTNEYTYVIVAKRASDVSDVEGGYGSAVSKFKITDQIPIGHTFVKGVDIFDGHLIMSSTDLAVPGAGPQLQFSRTYSSKTSLELGTMGVGWSHNFDSKVTQNASGSYTVIGADSSGIRFFRDTEGELIPGKGYHGTLEIDEGSANIDYYTTGGVQYHFERRFGQTQYAVWDLTYIKDPNNRSLRVIYAEDNLVEPKLIAVEDSYGRKHEYTYERLYFSGINKSNEMLVSVIGPQGMRVDFTYDDYGRLITAAREDIRTEQYTYTDNIPEVYPTLRSKLTSYTDPNGNRTTYEYGGVQFPVTVRQGSGFLTEIPVATVTSINEPDIGISTFIYDFDLHETSVNMPSGVHSYTMNSYGGVETQIEPAGTREFTWDIQQAKVISETDLAGVVTEYVYDPFGNKLSDNKGSFIRSFTYVGPQLSPPYIKNLLESSTDYNSNITQYSYDAKGNLLELALGASTITNSYSSGSLISSIDANGNATAYRNDVYGNPMEIIDPEGGVSGNELDSRGYPVTVTDIAQGAFTLTTDGLGRVTNTVNSIGGSKSFTYDANGNKLSETDENGNLTRYSYDKADRLVSIINADGGSKNYSYDDRGNMALESDWKGQPTVLSYNTAGYVTSRQYPDGGSVSYQNDALGNPVSRTDENANVTTFTYDILSRLTGFTDPAGSVSYQLDGNGNQISVTDRLGRNTSFTFNYQNLPTSRINANGGVTSFSYDYVGNQVSEIDPEGRTRGMAYDKANRPTKKIDALGNIEEFAYNSRGLLTHEIDKRGGTQIHSYDGLGRRTGTKDEVGGAYNFSYDPAGNLITEVWPNGNSISYAYNNRNLKTSTTDSVGSIQTIDYDANANIVSQTDANGNVLTRSYDGRNRVTSESLPEGRAVEYSYDSVGNITSITDPRGGVTSITYDASNRETGRTDPAGTSQRTYDQESNITSLTDRRSNVTTFNYDPLNRVISSIDPLNQTMKFEYDKVGNRTTEVNKKNISTVYLYDKENRAISVTKAGLPIARYEYDANGNIIISSDANGNKTANEYDLRNLITRESRELASVTQYVYNNVGDPKTITDPEGRVTVLSYDRRRRLLSEALNGNSTGYTYDGNGNRLSLKKPEGNTWNYSYDGADRLVNVADPKSGVTRYTYDQNDNRISQTDALGQTTNYVYDLANRMLNTLYPDAAGESYTYDAEGNLSGLSDPSGNAISYSYDALNRPSTRSYAVSTPLNDNILSIAFAFDANSNLISATENYAGTAGTRVTTQSFDNFDRAISISYPGGKTLGYQYDPNGNRTYLTDADGKVTRYAYDRLNRPTSIATPSGLTSYSYDRSSAIKSVVYPTQAISQYAYDGSGRVSSIVNTQSGAVVSAFTYAYDGNGNPTNITEQQGGLPEAVSYSFDSLDRLQQAEYIDKRIAYAYDAAYNRTSELVTDLLQGSATENQLIVNRGYNYNSRNQLLNVTDNIDAAQSIAYSYDPNGNRASRAQAGETTEYVYDVRDHLREIKQGGSSIGQFLYDYQGLRVRKTVNGLTQNFIYDDQNVLQELDESGTTQAKFEYGSDRLISYNHSTEGQNYYFEDNLGSVTNVLKADGSIQARYQYDPYGKTRKQSGTSSNSIGFTGQYNDSELGLYYYKARYYDPELGSFLSQDSLTGRVITPPSLNRYLYVFANPAIYIDPTGNVELFANGANTLGDYNRYLSQQAKAIDDGGANGFVRFFAGVSIGTTKLFVSGAEGITRGVNFGSNLVIAKFSDDESIQAELDQTFGLIQKMGEGVDKAKENPWDTSAKIGNAALEFGGRLASGETSAIAELVGTVGDVIVPTKAAAATAKGVTKLADNISDAVADVNSAARATGRQASDFQRKMISELDATSVSSKVKSPVVRAQTANKQSGAAQRAVANETAALRNFRPNVRQRPGNQINQKINSPLELRRIARNNNRPSRQKSNRLITERNSNDMLQKLIHIQRGSGKVNARGVDNFTIGSLTKSKAEELGRIFVGPNSKKFFKNGRVIGFRSTNGLRQYRFPAQKKHGKAAGRTQANIEEFVINSAGKKVLRRDAHIDIVK